MLFFDPFVAYTVSDNVSLNLVKFFIPPKSQFSFFPCLFLFNFLKKYFGKKLFFAKHYRIPTPPARPQIDCAYVKEFYLSRIKIKFSLNHLKLS